MVGGIGRQRCTLVLKYALQQRHLLALMHGLPFANGANSLATSRALLLGKVPSGV